MCMSTLFVRNTAGREIRTLLEEIQAFYCLNDDTFRGEYQKTIENVIQKANEEIRKGSLSVRTEAMLLTLAGRGNGESAKLLAENQFRRCNVEAYPKLTVRAFPGFGHGDIINHPPLLADELTQLLRRDG